MFNDDSLDTNDWTPKKSLEVGLRIMKKGILPSVTLTAAQTEALLEQLKSLPPEATGTSDTERLNWLEQRADGFANIDRITSEGGRFNRFATLREAIDDAIKSLLPQMGE